MQWFTIDKATNAVRGWHRSSAATALPTDTATEKYVAATDANLKQYSDLQAQSLAANRDGTVEMVNGALQLPADTRPYFRVVADQTSVAVGATVNVTVTALNPDGTTNTALTGMSLILKTANGRKWKLDFTNGVAIKTFTPVDSGDYNVESSTDYRVEAPMHIEVYE